MSENVYTYNFIRVTQYPIKWNDQHVHSWGFGLPCQKQIRKNRSKTQNYVAAHFIRESHSPSRPVPESSDCSTSPLFPQIT